VGGHLLYLSGRRAIGRRHHRVGHSAGRRGKILSQRRSERGARGAPIPIVVPERMAEARTVRRIVLGRARGGQDLACPLWAG
jgi:hypothetical protein